MLLKNSAPFIAHYLGFTNVSNASVVSAYNGGTKITNLQSVYTYYNFGNLVNTFITNSPNDYGKNAKIAGVMFGTGTGTPTVDDSCLFGNFIPGLTYSNITYVKTINAADDLHDGSITIVYTISNTTDADITIGEVALATYVEGYEDGKTYSSYYPILIEHTALDTPITIPPGGVGQVTYTISMDYPTFS